MIENDIFALIQAIFFELLMSILNIFNKSKQSKWLIIVCLTI
jgi:hypothetical protein